MEILTIKATQYIISSKNPDTRKENQRCQYKLATLSWLDVQEMEFYPLTLESMKKVVVSFMKNREHKRFEFLKALPEFPVTQ